MTSKEAIENIELCIKGIIAAEGFEDDYYKEELETIKKDLDGFEWLKDKLLHRNIYYTINLLFDNPEDRAKALEILTGIHYKEKY